MKFEIGPGLSCDLDVLLETRLVLTASSGGGKSMLQRLLLEQTFGRVQQWVIDTEGEFSTMRPQFDYVLVAHDGGEAAADPRIAPLLTRRLLELNASAIMDISELKPKERIAFVRRVAETLVDVPRALWHPLLIVIDEAQIFCPQHGNAESMEPINDLMGRARKRGFCPILSTLRPAMLHNDSMNLCQNKLIGVSMEADAKRAADQLGLSGREGWRQLQTLDPGEFYAFGPAFPKAVTRVKAYLPETRPPKRGVVRVAAPPPSAKVSALLPQLIDLPAEAEHERQSIEDLKRDNANLRRQVTLAKKDAPPPDETIIERRLAAALTSERRAFDTQLAEGSKRTQALERMMLGAVEALSVVGEAIGVLVMTANEPDDDLTRLRILIEETGADIAAREKDKNRKMRAALEGAQKALMRANRALEGALTSTADRPAPKPTASAPQPKPTIVREPSINGASADLSGIRSGAVRILKELARRHPLTWTKAQVAQLTGFTASGGTFTTYIGDLKRNGLIDVQSKDVRVTDAGLDAAGEVAASPASHEEVMEMWREKMRAGEYRLLEAIAEAGADGIDKATLAEATEFTMTGGTFTTYIGTLRRNALIEVRGSQLVPSPMLWPELA